MHNRFVRSYIKLSNLLFFRISLENIVNLYLQMYFQIIIDTSSILDFNGIMRILVIQETFLTEILITSAKIRNSNVHYIVVELLRINHHVSFFNIHFSLENNLAYSHTI